MIAEWVRKACLEFPGTTESVQWGDNLVFKVGGKMYAVTSLSPSAHALSFKTAGDEFAELVERPGIVPAPYLARAKWVAVERDGTLTRGELKTLLRKAYDEVVSKLPKKTQAPLNAPTR